MTNDEREQSTSGMFVKYLEGAAIALRCAIGSHEAMGGRVHGRRYDGRAVEALRGVLPYCLHPASSGDNAPFVWLNRDYKPLGVLPFNEFVTYSDFPWMHVCKEDPRIAFILSECKRCNAFCDGHPIFYLYDDATSPRRGKANATRLLGIIERVLATSGNHVPQCDIEGDKK